MVEGEECVCVKYNEMFNEKNHLSVFETATEEERERTGEKEFGRIEF